jgi:hypothetical protein
MIDIVVFASSFRRFIPNEKQSPLPSSLSPGSNSCSNLESNVDMSITRGNGLQAWNKPCALPRESVATLKLEWLPVASGGLDVIKPHL